MSDKLSAPQRAAFVAWAKNHMPVFRQATPLQGAEMGWQAALAHKSEGGAPFGCVIDEEADFVPHVHPEYGSGVFCTEDCLNKLRAPVAPTAVPATQGDDSINEALDQEWDQQAEAMTKAMGLGGGQTNPNATSVIDLFVEDEDTTITDLQTEIARLNAIINTPQSNDFLRAVSIEAEHQRQRWSSDHDAGKTPADWFWLVGYLGGKALHSHSDNNIEKAEHHIITTAAALANWHLNMFGNTSMRAGIDGEDALQAKGGA